MGTWQDVGTAKYTGIVILYTCFSSQHLSPARLSVSYGLTDNRQFHKFHAVISEQISKDELSSAQLLRMPSSCTMAKMMLCVFVRPKRDVLRLTLTLVCQVQKYTCLKSILLWNEAMAQAAGQIVSVLNRLAKLYLSGMHVGALVFSNSVIALWESISVFAYT